jgi:hypothetical protein
LNKYLLRDAGYENGADADGRRHEAHAFRINGLDCLYHPEGQSVGYIDPRGENARWSSEEEDPRGPPGRRLFYANDLREAIQWCAQDYASGALSFMHYRAQVRLAVGPMSEDEEDALSMWHDWQGVSLLRAVATINKGRAQ